jgi:hypothetical protein
VENRWPSFLIFAFVLLVTALLAVHQGVPDPVPATAPPAVFSSLRALSHLNTFATAPHPIGSAEHDRVRDYLLAQFRALGITPEVQRTTGITSRYRVGGTVENIVARLKGSFGSSDAVALVAHYDSVPAGPGAGDDGSGVASILETLRALEAGPPLRNDMLFVITDGEEDGLLGASAFVAENPNAKDIRVLANFEARGNAGPSQMFETSSGNGRLVNDWATAAPHPDGSSLTYEVYKHMPNDTDMTVFKRAGDAGLNFAFIGNWEAYHTPLDNPQLLDRGSLQQDGENALSFAQTFGNADLSELHSRDGVYFSLPGNLFLRYSTSYVWPLAILSGLLLLGAMFYASGAWQTRLSQVFASFFLQLALLLLLLLLGLGFETFIRWLHRNIFAEGPLDQNIPYLLSLLSLSLAGLFWFSRLIQRWIAAWLLFLVVLATSLWLPGGSYVFVGPLLVALLATLTVAFRRSYRPVLLAAILCLFAIPTLLLFIPLLTGFFQGLGFTWVGAPLLAVTLGLLFFLLFPVLEPPVRNAGNSLPLLLLAASAVCFISAASTTEYSAAHPKPSMLAYALDADTGKAVWASSASRLDSWTAEYLGASPTRGKLPDFFPEWYPIEFLQHEAPTVTLAPPQATLVTQSQDATGRVLRLRIASPRHARTIHVGVSQGQVLSASANGRDLGQPSQARWNQNGPWTFDYCNPGDGFDLELHLQGAAPITLVLVDRSSGLIPGAKLPPRPADSMPVHSGDQTMVRRSFTF